MRDASAKDSPGLLYNHVMEDVLAKIDNLMEQEGHPEDIRKDRILQLRTAWKKKLFAELGGWVPGWPDPNGAGQPARPQQGIMSHQVQQIQTQATSQLPGMFAHGELELVFLVLFALLFPISRVPLLLGISANDLPVVFPVT